MKLIDPSVEIISPLNGKEIMEHIEKCGRICYKSENLIKDGSADVFLSKILKSAHESVIEHFSITVKFIGSRSMSHQLVRHRIASYSQESQRYCNYTKDKFGGDVIFIKPRKFDKYGSIAQKRFEQALLDAENSYNELIKEGLNAQDARDVLPNACKTEIMVTMNLRSWRHFLKTRTSKHAQDEIRYLSNELLKKFKTELPVIFNDIEETL